MRSLATLLLCLLLALFPSCNESSFEPLSDSDLEILYAESQYNFVDFFEKTQFFPSAMSRMMPMLNFAYETAVSVDAMRGSADVFFQALNPSLNELIRSGEAKEWHFLSGTSKIMKAYAYQVIIDLNDSTELPTVNGKQQSLNGNTNFNFGFPPDSNYFRIINLFDAGISDLQKAGKLTEVDVFYGGNANQWIKLANSLKLRALNNIRLVYPDAQSDINELLQDGNFIESNADNWEFTYEGGQNLRQLLPPLFRQSYLRAPNIYMSNYYMWLLVGEKEVDDPRSRFYFYRQIPDFSLPSRTAVCYNFDPVSPDSLPVGRPAHYEEVDPNMPFCIADFAGYYGRDHGGGSFGHGENSRTLVGIYPHGGKFDDNSFEVGLNNTRARGESLAVLPIYQLASLYFIRAEAALTLGTLDDPAEMLEKGIRASFERVLSTSSILDSNFSADSCGMPDCKSTGEILDEIELQVEPYIAYVLAAFNTASSQEEKIDILMKEHYISLWGNGVEAYNNYRRTAMPLNIQPVLEDFGGTDISFPRRTQAFNQRFGETPVFENEPVFWDNNDASLFR